MMSEKKKYSRKALEELDRIFKEWEEDKLVEEWIETHEPK